MNFEELLEEASKKMKDKTTKMTAAQRKKVSAMGKLGWSILKKVETKVIMHKNNKEVFIYDSGKTFFITPKGKEVEVTDVVEVIDKD